MWKKIYNWTDPESNVSEVHQNWLDADTPQTFFQWKEGSMYYMRDIGLGAVPGMTYTISSSITPAASNPSSAMITKYFNYNGKRWYLGYNASFGNVYNWYDSVSGTYIISKKLGYGMYELWNTSTSAYVGDVWFNCGTRLGTYLARGSLRGTTQHAYGGTPATMAQDTFNGWSSSNFLGLYTAQGSETGQQFIGWRTINDNYDDGFVETPNVYSYETQTFATAEGRYLWYNVLDDKWYITIGGEGVDFLLPELGYWTAQNGFLTLEGMLDDYELTYTGDSAPTPPTYVLSSVTYSGTEQTVATSDELKFTTANIGILI